MPSKRTPIGYEITLVALATEAQVGPIVAFPPPAPVSLPATGYGLFAVAMAAKAEAEATYVLAA
ncbi:MAG: hypothetical protein AAF962_06455 [Actinomycetota bacterium]